MATGRAPYSADMGRQRRATGTGRARRAALGAGALLVALVLVAAATVAWVTYHRPGLRPGESHGIDVSNHQGPIDWTAVAGDKITFAYIKASEGADFTDRQFANNWPRAAQAGLRRGAYHFFTLCRPGRDQASHFLRTAPPEDAALPPAVDLELAGNCRARPTPAEVQRQLDDFLTAVEAAWGRQVLLYVGEDWEAQYPLLDSSPRPHWLVSHVGRPSKRWTVWQLHGFAYVDGVEGRVDLDVGRLADFDRRG